MAMRNIALLGSAALINVAAGLNTVAVQGQNFVDSVTNNRFEIIGVDYQPGGSSGYDPGTGTDPLSNADNCLRDAALLQRLGANAIRTYNLDPDVNHDQCASIFNAAGIYMILDVNSPLPNESINQLDPSSSYDVDYLNRSFAIIDSFRGYPNTMAFFSANELVNDDNTAKIDPPYIRAVTRDLKQYMSARGGRSIPIGYSAADVREILVDTTNYISCHISSESDDISRSDFIGVNGYSWCGDATFTSSHYDQLAEYYAATTIPVFFSEYGCNQVTPRTFGEVQSIYGTDMPTFSGGLAYEWTQEENNYGLVQMNDNNTLSLLGDYDRLQAQFAKIDLKLVSSRNDTATNLKAPDCQASLITNSTFDNSFDMPDQPPGVADLIQKGVGGYQGKLVDVNNLAVSETVYDSSGNQIKGLSVSRVSSANSPNASGSTPTSGASMANVAASGGVAMGAFVGSLVWLLG